MAKRITLGNAPFLSHINFVRLTHKSHFYYKIPDKS